MSNTRKNQPRKPKYRIIISVRNNEVILESTNDPIPIGKITKHLEKQGVNNEHKIVPCG